MKLGFARAAIVLGLLAAVGPIAIDLYLPALPQIAAGLNTDISAVQSTFTAYFVAFGVAQLLYGPMADWLGRKPPAYAGLAIFLAGSLMCQFAPSIEWLTIGRFIQALGAAATMVIPRAVVRDLYTGVEATQLMAFIMLVIAISPMLAPLAGSAILAVSGWRTVFAAFAAMSALVLLLVTFALPETLKPENRQTIRPVNLLHGCASLLRDYRFMALTLTGGFGFASFFVFLASAAFVLMDHYGLSPFEFSLLFGVNAIGFFGASQFAPMLSKRLGPGLLVKIATPAFATFYVAMAATQLIGSDSLPVIFAFLFLGNACFGLVMAPTMVMALEAHGDKAGLASSLGGTLQMVTGSVMIWVSQPFFDGTALPMTVIMMLCALIAAALALTTPPAK